MHDIAKFLSGFRRFQESYFCRDAELFNSLQEGQNPGALVIACSDSRVDPAILMDCAPGDLFVVRNVANLVPPYAPDDGHHGVSAALEFAVKSLKVGHIIVLGHGQCGGIKALLEQDCPTDTKEQEPCACACEFIHTWVNIAAAAKERVKADLPEAPADKQQRACEQAAVLISLDNLLGFPWVRERVERGVLFLHGWYFDLERGELLSFIPETSSFEPLVSRCRARD